MIDLEGHRPEDVRIVRVYKIKRGTVDHGCCACHKPITKRKMKLLTALEDRTKQFFLCMSCYTSPPQELRSAIIRWHQAGILE